LRIDHHGEDRLNNGEYPLYRRPVLGIDVFADDTTILINIRMVDPGKELSFWSLEWVFLRHLYFHKKHSLIVCTFLVSLYSHSPLIKVVLITFHTYSLLF
jgi:hypothetical protein